MEFAGKYKSRERRERALHLLDLVGLSDQAHKLPSMVSGGQQQRAAIARALANDPVLLVADEPTGNQDAKTAAQVFDLFLHLVEEQGKTMIMVTHDKELADRIPREVEIVNGRIVSDRRTASHAAPGTLETPALAATNGTSGKAAALPSNGVLATAGPAFRSTN
jgi:putative ABC transport system ATP-binding protein